jgi:hypothetical protein
MPLSRLDTRRGVLPAAVLALVSVIVTRAVLAFASGRVTWSSHAYLHVVMAAGFLILWWVALSPARALASYRGWKSRARPAVVTDMAMMLAVAALLVSLADIGFHLGGSTSVSSRLRTDSITLRAWLTNTALLGCFFTLAYAITRRALTAVLLVAPVFLLLVVSSFVKLRYLHSVVQPLDLLRIPELLPLFRGLFGGGTIAAVGLAAVSWVAGVVVSLRTRAQPASPLARLSIAAGSVAVIVGLPLLFMLHFNNPPVARLLGWMGASPNTHREAARETGILLAFVSELPAMRVTVPAGYERERVLEIADRYRALPATTPPRVNVVVYLIESLMDPMDLGYHFTHDPIPTIRSLIGQNGFRHAVVPAAFAGSSRSEFEVLTGMSTGFLPRRSLPYRQYLKHPIPSLPRVLREHGYLTVAVQPDPRHYYDRERSYPLLGFEDIVWLGDSATVGRDARVPWWPSDAAVVDAVISASRRSRPSFVFAFPSSSHSPYDRGTFAASALDLVDPPAGVPVAEVKEYVNALHVADREVARLIASFSARSDSTVIVVVGDHLPPLSPAAFQGFLSRTGHLPDGDRYILERRVPMAVWANFELTPGDSMVSLDAIPGAILERIGIPLPASIAVARATHARIPVLNRQLLRAGRPGEEWTSLPEADQKLLREHHLLHYDILLGRQFSLEQRPQAPAR